MLINNRPDAEVGPAENDAAMRAAAAAAGMEYHHNPSPPARSRRDDRGAGGRRWPRPDPTRLLPLGQPSTVLWALSRGLEPADGLIQTARAGQLTFRGCGR